MVSIGNLFDLVRNLYYLYYDKLENFSIAIHSTPDYGFYNHIVTLYFQHRVKQLAVRFIVDDEELNYPISGWTTIKHAKMEEIKYRINKAIQELEDG